MTDRHELSRQDRDLVRRALEARRAPAPERQEESIAIDPLCDDLTLAAYLDGKLGDEARDRLEAVLAESPDDAALWLAASDGLQAPRDRVPDAVIRRAQALVGSGPAMPATGAPAPRPGGLGAWLAGLAEVFAPTLGGLPRAFGGAMAVLALIVVSATGFELGRAGYGNLTGAAAQGESLDDGFADLIDDLL